MKKWTRIKDKKENKYLKVYESDQGDYKIIYPKAPKWAQKVAYEIWKDANNGVPYKKGVKTIVKGLWAKMIAEAAK
jgi:hypothetical protein